MLGTSLMRDYLTKVVLPIPSVKGNFAACGLAMGVKNIFFPPSLG